MEKVLSLEVPERHYVKDIAPTLAAILGINFPILTTGNVLSDAIK
jgi:hypothetical protein